MNLGFFSGQRLQDAIDQGVYVLTRVPAWTAFFDDKGQRLDLFKELRWAKGDCLERSLRILHGSKVTVRLLAVRVPDKAGPTASGVGATRGARSTRPAGQPEEAGPV